MTLDASSYVIIPADYADGLGGLHWSTEGEAIVTRTGETFAFAPQVWQFIEGFISIRTPLQFAHMLHLMHLLGVGPIARVSPGAGELMRSFLLAGRPLRNAGIFCAKLCGSMPESSRRLQPAQIRQELLHYNQASTVVGKAPSLSFAEFEQRFLKALERFTSAEILFWLKFGQAPQGGAGDRIAEEIDQKPPNLLAKLAQAAQDRERLAGALALVASLNGALALPPRRLDRSDLPVGGYADVTARGEPERLLPSQFALEGEEFVRRFAEHELLYFRREEPADPTREELVVLLDQGVRTWGGPRLALAGAVFAFARIAQRRKMPFQLAATSNNGVLIDPLEVPTEELTRLLEASDLTAHPAEALCVVLDVPSERLRDIVLLTHPRSLTDEEFVDSVAELGPARRLFAVSVDSEGRGRLDQIRDGRPVALGRFRVDLAAADKAGVSGQPIPTDPRAWTGDVEAVPFPFWFGPVKTVRRLGFDHGGEWLLVATDHGLLHAQSTDGTRRELLPRGTHQGQVLREVEAILGVNGGFVVCGRLTPEHASDPVNNLPLVAYHYDFHYRRVRAHSIRIKGWVQNIRWFCFADLHCLGCRAGNEEWAIDLDTGGRVPNPEDPRALTARARVAADRLKRRAVPMPHVATAAEALDDDPWYLFDKSAGWIELGGVDPEWSGAAPESDGRPALREAKIVDIQLAGQLAAVLAMKPGNTHSHLFILRCPDAALIRELTRSPKTPEFRLSDGGQLIAIPSGPQEVAVYRTSGNEQPMSVMSSGRCHNNVQVELGVDWLRVVIGQYGHHFRWDTEVLGYCNGLPDPNADAPTLEVPTQLSPFTRYDSSRFLSRVKSRLRLEVDRFGHVLMLDPPGERLLAMFWFRRDKAAGWLPDGTRWGEPSIAGVNTADAPRLFARALRQE